MSLSDLGNLGEFLASIGVLVSLIFVGFQMKQNAKAIRASVKQAVFDSTLSYHNAQIDPRMVATAQFKLDSGIDIDEFEKDQIGRLQHMNLRGFENRYYQYKQGFIDEEAWLRSRAILWYTFNHPTLVARNSVVRGLWKRMRFTFPRDFVEEIDSVIALAPERATTLWGGPMSPAAPEE